MDLKRAIEDRTKLLNELDKLMSIRRSAETVYRELYEYVSTQKRPLDKNTLNSLKDVRSAQAHVIHLYDEVSRRVGKLEEEIIQ